MTNIVTMTGVETPSVLGEPRPSLVAMLEDLLQQAKDGELQSLVGTGFMADGNRIGVWGDFHENVYEMMGALQWLIFEYERRHTDN